MSELQKRHYDYVLGPNQDARLASVATGSVITELLLPIENDAPFVLTGRAVRAASAGSVNMQGLRTRFTGPNRDYRTSGGKPAYIRESLQGANYGMFGNPKPIVPGVKYPPGSVLMLDLLYDGAVSPLVNLTFYFRGYKLYPWGSVPGYTYPKKLSSLSFAYPVPVVAMGINEVRYNQLFTVKQDADFVIRGGQGPLPHFSPSVLSEVFITLKDFNKQPYSSDFMPFDVLFGYAPTVFEVIVGGSALLPAFGTGPGAPGLFWPEIYVPKNHQLLYDLQRTDGAVFQSSTAEDFTFTLIGGKAFQK